MQLLTIMPTNTWHDLAVNSLFFTWPEELPDEQVDIVNEALLQLAIHDSIHPASLVGLHRCFDHLTRRCNNMADLSANLDFATMGEEYWNCLSNWDDVCMLADVCLKKASCHQSFIAGADVGNMLAATEASEIFGGWARVIQRVTEFVENNGVKQQIYPLAVLKNLVEEFAIVYRRMVSQYSVMSFLVAS
jgi:hypothetical protein